MISAAFCFVECEGILRASNNIDCPRDRGSETARNERQKEVRVLRHSREAASSLSTTFSSSCTTSSSYFCWSVRTIRQIARNNGTPPGDPFQMLHALTLAALLAHQLRIAGNPLVSCRFFRWRKTRKTFIWVTSNNIILLRQSLVPI